VGYVPDVPETPAEHQVSRLLVLRVGANVNRT